MNTASRLGDVISQHYRLVTIVSVLACLLLMAGAANLRFSADFRAYFSDDNPQLLAFEALEADFNKHGAEAIEQVRQKKPEVYIKGVADLLPKEANINVEAGEAFAEMWRRISDGLGDALADCLHEPTVVLH